ncbi:hypothetical protein RRG08_038397 [Elysia crispata]|uniref:Uncharacterized protein n=1 Tax=Elysia crispata TaxID=231223 RepID=A0AAE1A7C8_9GAST|nr:hypothetical protein RRG08_038397 [Elysia crispata]
MQASEQNLRVSAVSTSQQTRCRPAVSTGCTRRNHYSRLVKFYYWKLGEFPLSSVPAAANPKKKKQLCVITHVVEAELSGSGQSHLLATWEADLTGHNMEQRVRNPVPVPTSRPVPCDTH